MRGKYLLFIGVSFVCFLAAVPYTFFGWQFLLLHVCCLFFQHRDLNAFDHLFFPLEAQTDGFEQRRNV
ncbi:DUF5687 family protein [Algoriphagus boritolerans]|uniref:DUF5687 family protein n=1 Tax=Algoriphagus boritolerans TaxID=308111 RepID=UPI002FCE285F